MARKSRKNLTPVNAMDNICDLFNVGAYVRLSAVDKKHKGDSIETQQAIISAFIAERPELVLRETYIDNGTSGTTFERQAFQQMLIDAQNGKINCLITKDLSRLGRNAIDTGFYIDKYFPANKIRFIAINDEYDSANADSSSLMISLKNMINESYALDIGRKIRATKQINIRQGAFIGRFPPYGYLKSPENNHLLIRDDIAAPVILKIFELAADNVSVTIISRQLNEADILPPKRYFHSIGLATEKEANGHIHWNKGAVYSILHNRVYLGDMVQGKYQTKNYVEKKLPQSEWIVTENTHEPLVSDYLWEQVQKRWQDAPKRKKGSYSENIFLRKLYCKHCGYTMRRTRQGKEYRFKCETRSYYNVDDCFNVSINEKELKKQLLAEIRKHVDIIDSVLKKSQSDESDKAELSKVRLEIQRAEGFLKSLYESMMLGDITVVEYRDMKLSYETNIAALMEREQQLYNIISKKIISDANRQKSAKVAGVVCKASDLTKELMDALVERIEVYEDKSISVKFKFMEQSVHEMEGVINE